MPVWIHNPSQNLLEPENLARIREALMSGPIFGYWYRAHSGSGPNYWMARDFAEFERLIAQARPADYYVIWSLPALREKDVALAVARYDDQPERGASLLSPESLRSVERFLSERQWREVYAVFFGTDRGAEAEPMDLDGLDDISEKSEWYNRPGGEGYIFPFDAYWEKPSPDGFLPHTIERPEYWLLEAQYPNESGEVLEKHA